MRSIIIFASGAGSNAKAIIDHFRHNSLAVVSLIVCNKAGAGVLDIAAKEGISVLHMTRDLMLQTSICETLRSYRPDLLVLAGFLWKLPTHIVDAFDGKIINIHPALLPAYSGKGMYGAAVHAEVVRNREGFSGITIHHVNEHYDEGDIIMQARHKLTSDETPESLAAAIHRLEHFYYPRTIEYLLMQQAL